MINNAGQRQRKSFLKISKKNIREIFDVNFFSIFNLTQKYVKYSKNKNFNCSVVNISSIVGSLGFEDLSGYGSTKSALDGLTKCLASEFKGRIRFNSIQPGFTKTSFYEKFKKKRKSLYKWTLSRIPMKRWGNPNEIAELIFFYAQISQAILMVKRLKLMGVGQIHESSRTNTNKIKLY